MQQHAVVTLKGEPGTGKTYAALKYASPEHKRTAFLGKRRIKDWLKPATHGEAVLILDEANLSNPGAWDFLLPLLNKKPGEEVSIWYQGEEYRIADDQHKVIFTCNPETYPGRHYHPIIQDSPQLFVKGWTRKTLNKHIVQPLLRDILQDEKAATQTATLEKLFTVLQRMNHILATPEPKNWYKPLNPETAAVTNAHLSLRDVQQLMARWVHHLKLMPNPSEQSYAQAAYEACYLEWGLRFVKDDHKRVFQQVLQQLFNPTHQELQQFAGYQSYQEKIVPKLPTDYYLSQPQHEWLFTLYDDLEMGKELAELKIINPIDQTPLAKTGALAEGPSGIGKTSLFLALAEAMKLIPLTAQELKNSSEKDLSSCYIHFTPTGIRANNRRLLSKAFDRGCKVILDELNLDPSLESLLNQLLTGKTPSGKLPTTRGFFVFSSQNPRHYHGNKAQSLALKNRFHALQLELNAQHLAAATEIALRTKIKDPTLRQKRVGELVQDYQLLQKQYPDYVNPRTYWQEIKRMLASLNLPQAPLLWREQQQASCPKKILNAIKAQLGPILLLSSPGKFVLDVIIVAHTLDFISALRGDNLQAIDHIKDWVAPHAEVLNRAAFIYAAVVATAILVLISRAYCQQNQASEPATVFGKFLA